MPRKANYTRNRNYGKKRVFASTRKKSYGGSWFSTAGITGRLTVTEMLPLDSPQPYRHFEVTKFKIVGRKK